VFEGADAHNIFFQVLAEHGVTGLLLYVGLLGVTMADLRKLVRRTKRRPELRWLHTYGEMMQGCLVAYIVAGFFLSLSYFDLYFHFVAIAVILTQLLRMAEREAQLAPVQGSIATAAALPT
jgi:O-antigen ligase